MEEFKLIKEAYETLKNPQKRYMYDTGINSDNIDESVYSAPRWKESGRKYYENKWYGFKKNEYPDQRDEYYENKFAQSDNEYLYVNRIVGLGIVLVGFIGYEYLASRKSAADV